MNPAHSGLRRQVEKKAAAVTGILTGTVNTASSVTLDSITGVTAYRVHNPGVGNFSEAATLLPGGTEISAWSFYGTTPAHNNGLANGITLTWTGATGGSGTIPSGNDANNGMSIICGTTEMGLQATANADTTTRKVRVYCRSVNFSGNVGIKCRATLSDGSATALVKTQTSGDTDTYFEFTYRAATSGQTLLLQLFPETNAAGCAIGYGAITYGT